MPCVVCTKVSPSAISPKSSARPTAACMAVRRRGSVASGRRFRPNNSRSVNKINPLKSSPASEPASMMMPPLKRAWMICGAKPLSFAAARSACKRSTEASVSPAKMQGRPLRLSAAACCKSESRESVPSLLFPMRSESIGVHSSDCVDHPAEASSVSSSARRLMSDRMSSRHSASSKVWFTPIIIACFGRCVKKGFSLTFVASVRGAQMTSPLTSPSLRCVDGSKGRSDSTVSPNKSIRTGICALSG